jgi:hypothetical protein
LSTSGDAEAQAPAPRADRVPEEELYGFDDSWAEEFSEPPEGYLLEPDETFAAPRPNQDETAKEKLDRGQEELKNIEADRIMKMWFARSVYWLVVGWMAIVVAMLFLSALNCLNMSEKLLITIVTATTIKVMGLLLVVVRHLFPLPPKK